MKYKKGQSFSGWTEAILMIVLVVSAMAMISVGVLDLYGVDTDLTLGLTTNNTLEQFTKYVGNTQTTIDEGESSYSEDVGLTFSGLWGLSKQTFAVIGTFLTGGMIEQLAVSMNLPAIVGIILRVLFVLSLVFILIKLVTKVKP